MDEADLLKERLQAITDKRRIQEDIAKKRRQIEEEKLKFQYIKKKTLRDQWLMDGLSQQSEEEQEAMRMQAQDDQQQSEQLQDNITRIEKEIEALETQELNISANEEAVLIRLKEVERSAEDIIKELNANFQPDVTHHHFPPLPDTPQAPPTCVPGSGEPKKATFAMEINVKHDKRTGKCEVVSTAAVTPETIGEEGLKVYEDSHRSVYARPSDGAKLCSAGVGEMTLTEVEELLRQAADREVHSEVQYHHPVYSVPYKGTGTSRPSTPRSNKALKQAPTPLPCQETILSRTEAQTVREGNSEGQEQEGRVAENKTPSPRVQASEKQANHPCFSVKEQSNCDGDLTPQSKFHAQDPTMNMTDTTGSNPAALVSIKARSEGLSTSVQTRRCAVGGRSPLSASYKSEQDPDESPGDRNIHSPFCTDSIYPQNHVCEPVTMIFMGYENAVEEEKDIQAELVVISSSDEEDEADEYVDNESGMEEYLSYHPQGYKSKVFLPKVGMTKEVGVFDIADGAYTNCGVLGLHKPTFMHKPGRGSCL